MAQNKILSLLGLAMRGRNLASGEFQTLESVKNGSAMLVIIARDASANTKKLFTDKCSFYGVPVYEYSTKEELGRAIGQEMRSSLGVRNAGLADAIIKQLEMKEYAGDGRNGGKHGENKDT